MLIKLFLVIFVSYTQCCLEIYLIKKLLFRWLRCRISPPIFLFLISIIPSIWILEIHHHTHKDSNSKVSRLQTYCVICLIQQHMFFKLWYLLAELVDRRIEKLHVLGGCWSHP